MCFIYPGLPEKAFGDTKDAGLDSMCMLIRYYVAQHGMKARQDETSLLISTFFSLFYCSAKRFLQIKRIYDFTSKLNQRRFQYSLKHVAMTLNCVLSRLNIKQKDPSNLSQPYKACERPTVTFARPYQI